MTWSKQRQVVYFLIAAFIVIVAVGIPAFIFWYEKPTCFDGKKNAGELEADCGGSCIRLCQSTEIKPVVEWQQAFEVKPGVYNAVAYVQNPNVNSEAKSVPYVFTFRDAENKVVAERSGRAFVPAGKSFAVFESSIVVPNTARQIRTDFQFTGVFGWMSAATTTPRLLVRNLQIKNLSQSPVVEADIQNPSLENVGRIDVTAIVYDTEGNAVGASKTYLDELKRQSAEHVVFTWPQPFMGQVASCQQPTDVVLAIDRSGSMASDGKNPPEPLTSVKNAAVSFVDALRERDTVGLVSFATEASSPIDKTLTDDRSAVRESIQGILIKKGGTQYTNIYDAITRSLEELATTRHRAEAKRAIILLTDGNPTYPEIAGDKKYPFDKALSVAREAQSQGIEVYTIGLGSDIDEDFLKLVSGFTERYYRAPQAEDLVAVYKNISSALCKLGPAKVEIIPDIISR